MINKFIIHSFDLVLLYGSLFWKRVGIYIFIARAYIRLHISLEKM